MLKTMSITLLETLKSGQAKLRSRKLRRNNKYLVITDKATWHHAINCDKLGGHLVRVDDAQEQAFLEKLAAQSFKDGPKGNSVWIDA